MKNSTRALWRMVASVILPLLVCITSIAQPVITSFSPASGGPPGATVTINGSGFDPIASNNIVRFGALSATVTAATANQLTVTAPIAASYAKISVAKGGFVAESIQNYSTTIPMTNTLNSTSFQHLYFAANHPTDDTFVYRNQVATDIDGDGIMDIVAHLNAQTLILLRGNGTGFFPTQIPLVIYRFIVVDLDGDGKKDLVTTNGTDVSTYRNTSTPGSISFGPQTPQASLPNGAYFLAYGDFNRDGKIDIVAANYSGIYIYGNNSTLGSISLSGGGLSRTITDTDEIAAEDLNNDGFYELLVISRPNNTVSILGNKAIAGTLASGTMDLNFTNLSLDGLTWPTKIATGDLTNDGFNDIVVTTEGNPARINIWRNLGSSAPVTASSFQFITSYSIAGANTPKSVKLADLDADGKVDIVMSSGIHSQGAPFIQKNNYSGSGNLTASSFTVGAQQSSSGYNSPRSQDVLPMDFNGDGRIDLAVFAEDRWNVIYMYKNTIKANQNITFPSLSAVNFGSAPFALPAFSTSGLPITYTTSNPAVVSIAENIATVVGVGSASISAFQDGTNLFNPALNNGISRTLEVVKGTPTFTFPAIPQRAFGDAPLALVASSNAGAVVFTSSDLSIASIVSNNLNVNGAGTVTISATFPGDANWNFASSPQIITINKANQTINFAALPTKTFGNEPYSLSASSSSLLPVTFSSNAQGTVSITGSTATILAAGSADITASQGGNANYNAATSVIRTQVVNKANQTITFNPLAPKTFGDAQFNLTATASSGLTPTYTSSNPAVATVSGITVTIVGAGSTTITASQSGSSNFNAATAVTQTLTVNKANQTITFNSLAPKTFGD
ncbi:MAG: VCBS repeat-containing protein, partial [Cytophagales bacterium]|nr:VCBS repeat-containing protein [Cytophagales bacterium]